MFASRRFYQPRVDTNLFPSALNAALDDIADTEFSCDLD
jgi:hypothetical protein